MRPCEEEPDIYELLRQKISELYQHFPTETHERVLIFCTDLEYRFPDARDHKFFHLLTGSTLEAHYGSIDFPSPDSIQEFIENEYAKAFPERMRKAG